MTTLSKCMMPSLKNELFNTLYLMIPDTSAVIYIIEMITNEIDNNARLFHISRWGGWNTIHGISRELNITHNKNNYSSQGHPSRIKGKIKGYGWKLPNIPLKLLRDIELLYSDKFKLINIQTKCKNIKESSLHDEYVFDINNRYRVVLNRLSYGLSYKYNDYYQTITINHKKKLYIFFLPTGYVISTFENEIYIRKENIWCNDIHFLVKTMKQKFNIYIDKEFIELYRKELSINESINYHILYSKSIEDFEWWSYGY